MSRNVSACPAECFWQSTGSSGADRGFSAQHQSVPSDFFCWWLFLVCVCGCLILVSPPQNVFLSLKPGLQSHLTHLVPFNRTKASFSHWSRPFLQVWIHSWGPWCGQNNWIETHFWMWTWSTSNRTPFKSEMKHQWRSSFDEKSKPESILLAVSQTAAVVKLLPHSRVRVRGHHPHYFYRTSTAAFSFLSVLWKYDLFLSRNFLSLHSFLFFGFGFLANSFSFLSLV